MPVYVDKKTKRLFIQIRLKGEFYKERLPEGTTRKVAEKLEVKIKNRLLFEQHGIYEDRKDSTYERFLQDVYLPHVEHNHSKDSFEKSIYVTKASLPFFKGRQLRTIKPYDVERFKQARMMLLTQHGTVRKPATVEREMAVISKLFTLAVKNDLMDYNPCERVEKLSFDNIQNKVLKWEDEEKLFANMHSDWAKDVCTVALYTGLRQNDIFALTRFQVHLDTGWIILVQKKTKRIVEAYINDMVRPILEQRLAKYKDGPLFPSPVTGEKDGSVRHALQRACVRAEIPVITIRDLRRTFATRADTDAVTLSRMLGHRDTRMVHRYHRSLDKMREASEKMVDSANSVPAVKLRIVK